MTNELLSTCTRLGYVLKDIHKLIPAIDIDISKIGHFDISHGYLNGKRIKRLIIYLRSRGCGWMLNDENGGCTMCGHLAGTTQGVNIPSEFYIMQFNCIFDQIDFTEIQMVCVYNAGSFFNDEEIPETAQNHIYKRLSSEKNIEAIIFESRPEYITDKKIKIIREHIPDKHIEIGIGVESSNDYIRQVCLNKGFLIDKFQSAISILKNYNILSLAYILLKPPFINEFDAINDTISTINWAFSHGVDIISIEPVTIQKNTLVHLLYAMNLYRSPWIWSVLSVINQVKSNGLIRIGGFEYFPLPDIYMHNCHVCNERCINAIIEYNATNNRTIISDILKLSCDNCMGEWKENLKDKSTIEENIEKFFRSYKKEKLSELLQKSL